MKKAIYHLAIVVIAIATTSCGAGYAYITNQNQNSTQVHLSENNFDVVGQAVGQAEVSYVLIFGGKNKRQLYETAYADMMKSAELSGAKALVNMVTEEHVGGVPPFYYTRTITVSANVVEFKD